MTILSEVALVGESERTESHSHQPKKKKKVPKTTSSVTQMDEVVTKGENLLLGAFSQQDPSIETSILPNAPSCKESAHGSNKDDTTPSEEHITIEILSISHGELPESFSTHTTLPESINTTNFSLEPANIQEIEMQGNDQ